jgi:hypothetical protein
VRGARRVELDIGALGSSSEHARGPQARGRAEGLVARNALLGAVLVALRSVAPMPREPADPG